MRLLDGGAARFALLLALSAVLATGLEKVGLPAGLLIGPMIAAIMLDALGKGVTLARPLSLAGQSIVGLLIATSFNPKLLQTVAGEPLLFIGATLATLAVSIGAGVVLTRRNVLPGTVAIWGSMPGAATAMTLMARRYDADERLVAVMTFGRVACVATLASIMASIASSGEGASGPASDFFPTLLRLPLAETIALATIGVLLGNLLKLPAGALIGPMILAGVLAFTGHLRIELPGWLLAIAYALVGWRIGLGFTAGALRTAARAAPGILVTIATLILLCAGLGWLIAAMTGRDFLTCYLATSPGGADSVAIIASETQVDVPFVMAMQVLRFVAVLIVGPLIARFAADRLKSADASGPTTP